MAGGATRLSAVADPIFAERRLAEIYDAFDGDRGDLDLYAAIVDEVGAASVLDIGCGTGTFACLLAARGKDVVGVDPAPASLAVGRGKQGAELVRWCGGDAAALPPGLVDVVTMTGNVAQVFLTDEEWATALLAAHAVLRPGGWLVFETRDPAARAWTEWTPKVSRRTVEIPGVGGVESEVAVTDVSLPLVTFRWTFRFAADGAALTSDSTLRFRSREEVEDSLRLAGFRTVEVRDAPDRPGLEFVFLARS